MNLDPRELCKCEFDANIDQLYNHGLGDTCGIPQLFSSDGDICEDDFDCSEGLMCREFVCEAPLIILDGSEFGDTCEADFNCLPGLACIDGQCVERFLPGGWGPEV
jgi:hypothetical protein